MTRSKYGRYCGDELRVVLCYGNVSDSSGAEAVGQTNVRGRVQGGVASRPMSRCEPERQILLVRGLKFDRMITRSE